LTQFCRRNRVHASVSWNFCVSLQSTLIIPTRRCANIETIDTFVINRWRHELNTTHYTHGVIIIIFTLSANNCAKITHCMPYIYGTSTKVYSHLSQVIHYSLVYNDPIHCIVTRASNPLCPMFSGITVCGGKLHYTYRSIIVECAIPHRGRSEVCCLRLLCSVQQ